MAFFSNLCTYGWQSRPVATDKIGKSKNIFIQWLGFVMAFFPFITRIMVHQRNRRIRSGHGFTGSFDATWSELSWPGSPQKERTQRFAYKSGIPLRNKRRRRLRLWVVEQEYKQRLNSFRILGKLVNVNLSCCTELPRPFQVMCTEN